MSSVTRPVGGDVAAARPVRHVANHTPPCRVGHELARAGPAPAWPPPRATRRVGAARARTRVAEPHRAVGRSRERRRGRTRRSPGRSRRRGHGAVGRDPQPVRRCRSARRVPSGRSRARRRARSRPGRASWRRRRRRAVTPRPSGTGLRRRARGRRLAAHVLDRRGLGVLPLRRRPSRPACARARTRPTQAPPSGLGDHLPRSRSRGRAGACPRPARNRTGAANRRQLDWRCDFSPRRPPARACRFTVRERDRRRQARAADQLVLPQPR